MVSLVKRQQHEMASSIFSIDRQTVLSMLARNREEEEQSQYRGSESIAWGFIEDKRGMMGKGDGKVPFSLWMVSLGKLWGTFE